MPPDSQEQDKLSSPKQSTLQKVVKNQQRSGAKKKKRDVKAASKPLDHLKDLQLIEEEDYDFDNPLQHRLVMRLMLGMDDMPISEFAENRALYHYHITKADEYREMCYDSAEAMRMKMIAVMENDPGNEKDERVIKEIL